MSMGMNTSAASPALAGSAPIVPGSEVTIEGLDSSLIYRVVSLAYGTAILESPAGVRGIYFVSRLTLHKNASA